LFAASFNNAVLRPSPVISKNYFHIPPEKSKLTGQNMQSLFLNQAGGGFEILVCSRLKITAKIANQQTTRKTNKVMSDLNDALKDSYIGKVADALQPYVTELKAGGFDPTSRITQLGGAGQLIESAARLSKQAQDAATAAVQHTQDVRNQFYTLATATVSSVEGAVGKGHELAVKLRSLRSDLIGNQNPGGTPAPTPTPAK
jgi:hypothetical protein